MPGEPRMTLRNWPKITQVASSSVGEHLTDENAT